MKKILIGLVALCTFHGVYADHQLETLSHRLAYDTRSLTLGARQAIGPYPSYRQQYAYEHIAFLESSSRRFEYVACNGVSDDHVQIQQAFRRVEYDVYYARQTFYDLFRGEEADDHVMFEQLNRLLRQIEYTVYEISHIIH